MKFSTSCENKDLAIEVMEGRKTETLRDKPYDACSIHPLEKRYVKDIKQTDPELRYGWKTIGKVKIKSCISNDKFEEIGGKFCEIGQLLEFGYDEYQIGTALREYRIRCEGYTSGEKLMIDLKSFYGSPLPPLYRIELEVLHDPKDHGTPCLSDKSVIKDGE